MYHLVLRYRIIHWYLPSPCPSIPEHISEHIHNTLTPAHPSSSSLFAFTSAPSSLVHSARRESQLHTAPVQQAPSWRLSRYQRDSCDVNQPLHPQPCQLSTLSLARDNEEDNVDEYSRTIRRSLSGLPPQSSSVLEAPVHAIATPKPTLLFAIASDDVNEVRQVLESGEAGPNDQVGPQSALAFTLTNDKLSHKNEIVKALLAYGADPSALRNPNLNPSAQMSPEGSDGVSGSHSQPEETMPEGMDPATRYYVTRADSPHTRQTSQLIYRSFFRPLTRVRYDLIGQDWVLEQLFRVLSMHSQRLSVAPIVVLLCGPSGHGKSLLARKFGSLLDIPTHTVNMTTLRSTHDLWQSYSMSPYEEPSSDTLAQFLLNNEGERCVVVLDEIEKVEDPKALYSLLMPWELGRCSLEVGKRHVNLTKVIWLGTSNIGHNVVFEYHDSRPDPSKPITRDEYRDLMDLSRPHVSQCLGASLLSRVTTVLPFIPFTLEEKMAIAAEAVYSLTCNVANTLSPQDVEAIVMKALPSYVPSEGARSLHRAVSNQLVDMI
ncbi:P-loop containing nucleoside triphosphate hydrolase protein [Suillus bovinus]|uniref:P-loop containing nucleoside triphosphate hydrolase protein n=1 Tax=Suillus bovinus TaxID=48563 RepID=UPI001B8827B4|nr:P-loop containing nucleoside triphosphate hydrolase protein [Suillus bovinus]KAG2150745.1 P-loop containing nucleoside triphosphate hydrolase protein [Suillus bovinus]